MAFDVIVFSQEELIAALRQGIKSIALCDNSFVLPDTEGIQYTIIGSVTIENEVRENSADKPLEENEDIPAYANVEPSMMAYSSSFDTSHSSSYGRGSYKSGSYTYEYGYEYGSFASSYASSYQTSFVSSYYSFISGMTFGMSLGGSFSFTGSFGGSYAFEYSYGFGASFTSSFSASYTSGFTSSYAPLEDIIEYGSSGIIFVNGYGINLI